MTLRILSLFSIAFVAAIFVSGCKSNSTSPNGGGTAITPPNAGSYFIAVNTETDSTGAVISLDTEKNMVILSNAAFYGKTGVTVFVDSDYQNGLSPDTTYLKYESTGDVEEYAGSSGNSSFNATGWITLPFGSQSSATLVNTDTTLGFGVHGRITEGVSGAGTGNVTVEGESFYVNKVNLQVSIIDTASAPTFVISSISFTTTASFAPALGYIVETDQPAYRTDGELNPSIHGQMISYHLQ
ncbi:MAG TPA: hypothetical protein VGM92_03555 [Candidatus Kapabacteria bacterium]